jgi:hypothetical protein
MSYHLRDKYPIYKCCWNAGNNSMFGDFVDRIFPIELEIKDTTDTYKSASNLDLHLEIDSEGRLRTKPYDTRDDRGRWTLGYSISQAHPKATTIVTRGRWTLGYSISEPPPKATTIVTRGRWKPLVTTVVALGWVSLME